MAVMKFAIGEIDAFVFNAFRLPLSAAVLGICVWIESRSETSGPAGLSQSEPANLPRARIGWTSIALFAVFSGGFYQILFILGMDRTTAGNTALIMSSMPMWTALLSFFLLKEKLGKAWFGIIITFLGTLVVTIPKGGFSAESEFLLGNTLILISALAWSLGAIISRPMLQYVTPIRLAFYATFGTLPIHFFMVWYFSPSAMATIQELFTWQVIACIFYSGIFSTGLAYAMWNLGVKQMGASHASVYQNLVPLIALLVAWYFLAETVSLAQLAGGAMIIFGLFVSRQLRKRASKFRSE